MKNKWIVFVILLAIGMVFVGPQNAQADTWASCSIVQVGQDLDVTTLRLTETTSAIFTDKWFKLRATYSKQMLAIALTALSLGKDVNVLIANDGITINSIKVNN